MWNILVPTSFFTACIKKINFADFNVIYCFDKASNTKVYREAIGCPVLCSTSVNDCFFAKNKKE